MSKLVYRKTMRQRGSRRRLQTVSSIPQHNDPSAQPRTHRPKHEHAYKYAFECLAVDNICNLIYKYE